MQPGVATNQCAASVGAGLFLLFAACASGPPPAVKLNEAQFAKCRELEHAYRSIDKNDPEPGQRYVALRDELAKDPVAAAWVVRMLVHDIIVAREERGIGDDRELLAAAAHLQPRAELSAFFELRTLGAAAVPALIDDLLRSQQSHQRELGIELLTHVGAPSRAPLLQLVRHGETHEIRAAARALGRLGIDDEVFAVLRELAASSDFTVRADALRACEGGDERVRLFLCERMRDDRDPFVRRTAAQTLASIPTTASALAIVDFIERCRRESDREGERIAQRALMRMSGTYKARQPQDWRDWAPELDQRAAKAR